MGLGISDIKKKFRGKRNRRNKGLFPTDSSYSVEQKISEFRSEPFHGRENNSEFRSVEQI